jgi:hypothetical protein
MKRISLGNRLTPVLLTACVLFGVIMTFEWYVLSRQDGILTGSDVQPAAATDVQLTRTTYMTPDFEAFSEILERPLFVEGRTPPVQPDPIQAQPNVKKTPLRLQLEGVAITPEIRVAVVRDLGNKKLLKLEEGMKHQGWVLESVNTASATFKHGEQTEELILEIDKKSPGKRRSTYRHAGPPAVAGGRVTLDNIRLKTPATTGDPPPPVPAPESGTTPDDKKGGK